MSPTWPSTVPTAIDLAVGDRPIGVKIPAPGLTTSRSTANRCSPSIWAPTATPVVPAPLDPFEQLVEVVGGGDRDRAAPSTVRLAMPVSTPPGPSSAKLGDAGVLRASAGSASSAPGWTAGPTAGSTTRRHVVRLGVDVGHDRDVGVARCRPAAIASRSRSRAGAMNGVWKAPDTCSGMTFFAPSSLAWAVRRLDAVGGAGDHDLSGSVEVRDPDVGVGEVAGDLDLVVVETEHGGHRAGLRVAGVVHRCRHAATTRRTPSSKPSAPVAVSAVYSPRLWPAQKLGSMPRRSTASSTIRLDTNVVSWALRVSLELVGVGVAQQLARCRGRRPRWPRRPVPSSRGRAMAGPCQVVATPDRGR